MSLFSTTRQSSRHMSRFLSKGVRTRPFTWIFFILEIKSKKIVPAARRPSRFSTSGSPRFPASLSPPEMLKVISILCLIVFYQVLPSIFRRPSRNLEPILVLILELHVLSDIQNWGHHDGGGAEIFGPFLQSIIHKAEHSILSKIIPIFWSRNILGQFPDFF